MRTFGVWENVGGLGIGDAFLVAAVAILIVFAVIVIIILSTAVVQKGTDFVAGKMAIMPRPENKILEEDEDAVVAVLTATIDFHKETGKGARVVSVKRIDEE